MNRSAVRMTPTTPAHLFFTVLSAAACLWATASVEGGDWPKFLGPDGTGVSLETGLAKAWPPAGPPVLWKRRVGPSYSAPSITGDDLILFHRIENEEIVECLDARTADIRWKYAYPTRYVDAYGYNGGPRSAPVMTADRVFTLGAEGELHCLARKNGKPLWRRSLNKEFQVELIFFGVGTTPLPEGELLLINVGGPQGAGLAAFDQQTGKTVWTATDQSASYPTPVCATIHKRRYAFFFTREGLVVASPQTGEVHATYPFRSRTHESVNAASPVVVEDCIFLSASYRTGSVLLRVKEDGLEEVWKSMVMSNHWATSIYRDGYLYGIDGRHEAEATLRCVAWKTGDLVWQQEGLSRASMIFAGGHFIILTERGSLVLALLSPEGYEEKARTGPLLSYPCHTAPVLANGLLYIRSEVDVLCLDLREAEKE